MFPSSLLALVHLRVINLANNKIRELPSEISNIKTLVELNISNNLLEALPTSLASIPGLKVGPFQVPKITCIRCFRSMEMISKVPLKKFSGKGEKKSWDT